MEYLAITLSRRFPLQQVMKNLTGTAQGFLDIAAAGSNRKISKPDINHTVLVMVNVVIFPSLFFLETTTIFTLAKFILYYVYGVQRLKTK